MNDDPDSLALRAGPPPNSPPLPIALMIVALGIIGPVLFVRDAVPSVFLTVMTVLLPVAGVVSLIAAFESFRRRRADPLVRTRAVIGRHGVTLSPHAEPAETYLWHEIADAQVSKSVLMLHLNGEGGKRTRRAIRYGMLETPVEMLQGRLSSGLTQSRETVTSTAMSSKLH